MMSREELYRIYIWGLNPDLPREELEFEFDAFGDICYFHFHADQGYTLISYKNQWDAILAIANGNKMIIRGNPINVQWARGYPKNRVTNKEFEGVYNESCPNNFTIYCYQLSSNTTINILESIFSPFGIIEEIYTINNWMDRALIRFREKMDATLAICAIDGTQFDGQSVHCEWSRRPVRQLVASGWRGTRSTINVPFLPVALPPATYTSFRSPAVLSTTARTPTVFIASSRTTAVSSTTSRTPALLNSTSNTAPRNPVVPSTMSTTPAASITISTTLSVPSTVSTTHSVPSTISTTPAMSSTTSTTLPMFSTTEMYRTQPSTLPRTLAASETSRLSSDMTHLRERLLTLLQDSNNVTASIPSSTGATQISNFSASPSDVSNQEYTKDDFDTVFNQDRRNNCSVYIKGLLNITNEWLKKIFSPFGIIEEIDFWDGSDWAIIRFNSKLAATLAICSVNNTEINGNHVKCTWSHRSCDQNYQPQPETSIMQHYIQSARRLSPYVQATSGLLTVQAASSLPTVQAASTLPTAASSATKEKPGNAEKENQVKNRTTDTFCKICMDEELGVVFLPCGHLTACSKCAQKIYVCPLCRKSITSKIRTYLG